MQQDKIPYLLNSGVLHFSGMRGHLHHMQREGWNFAFQESFSPRHGDKILHLAGKHEKAGVELLAGAMLEARDFSSNFGRHIELEFHVHALAPRIQIVKHQVRASSVKWGFSPFDAEDMSYGELRVADLFEIGSLAFFRPVEASKEIYIPEKEIWTIEKHLEAILNEQKPRQDELRRKHLDEQRKKQLNEGCESRAIASLIAV